jgi:predicted Rossmann-fold nucleotide-binding protein
VMLPGGAGSLDEFFEVLTWRQLGLHAKPIFLLNVQGYWTPLQQLMDHVVAQGFADRGLLDFVTTLDSVEALELGLRAALA